MAEVTLGFDEIEEGDLPLFCMQCGSRDGVDFVERTFLREPLFAPPGLIKMAMTKRVHAAIPLCEAHGGSRLFAYRGTAWSGLRTAAIGADRITIAGVHESFAEALRKRREKRRCGEAVEFERPRRRVHIGRGPGGGKTGFKVLGVVAAVVVGLVMVMSCGMFGLMALMTLWLPRAPRPVGPVAVGPNAAVVQKEAQPENVVVALLGASPAAGLPGALPWAPLAQSARKETFNLLEGAELTKLLADLKSPNPMAVEQAAKRLTKAMPEDVRRRETADALTAALANPFPTAKEAVAEALGKWGAAEDAPALMRMLGDRNPSNRAAACRGLKGIGAKESLPALEALAGDPFPNVARAAAEAVQAIKARG